MRFLSGQTAALRAVIVGVLITVLAGCSLSDDERLARAQQAFDEGDYRTAAIDVRAVLQSAPDNVAARVLYGRTAMEQGDMAAAEEAFRRALELGADSSAVVVDLAGAMLAQRKFEPLLAEISPDSSADEDSRFIIRLARADAQLGLDLTRTARSTYEALIAERPDSSAARFGLASTHIAENSYDEARDALNGLLSRDPDFIAGRLASGSLALRLRDIELARAEFGRARTSAEEAGNARARHDAIAGLAETYLADGAVDDAVAALAELKASNPESLTTRYLDARIAFVQGDLGSAEPTLAQLLRDAPAFEPARLLMTALQLRAGNLAQAESYATSLLSDNPANEEARVLLAEVLLRQGRGREVMELIGDAVAGATNQDAMRALAIRSGLQTGQYESTLDLLRERVAAEPDNADAAIELAGTLMAAGRFEAAEAVMADAPLNSDRDTIRKESLSIYAALRQGEAAEAIRLATALTRRVPDSPDAQFLLGNTALAAGRVDLARLAFGETTRLAPNSLSPYLSLAAIARQSGDRDAARQHLRDALDANPEATVAAVRLARLEHTGGDTAAARTVLEDAIGAGGNVTIARLALAEISLDAGEFQRAYDEATIITDANTGNAAAQNLRGVALERLGRPADAAAIFAEAIAADDSAIYRINAARAYSAAGEIGDAVEVLTDAAGQPRWQSLPLATALARVRANQGDLASALDIARGLREYHSESPAPYAVEARLLASGGDFAGAARVYDDALRLSQYDRGIVLLAHNARAAGDVEQPEAPILEYLARNPNDLSMRTILGQSYSARGNRSAAISTYREALEAAPDNVTVLNNLAWEYSLDGNADAEPLARRAYELDPGNANVVDTLGWILVKNGKADDGVAILREALALDSNRAEIRYHLAAGLIRAGRTAEGRRELEAALANQQPFAERADAERLLETL